MRILVTNDTDFGKYDKNKIFAVILLQIPQHKPKALTESFDKLLQSQQTFSGKLILLKPDKWEELKLGVSGG